VWRVRGGLIEVTLVRGFDQMICWINFVSTDRAIDGLPPDLQSREENTQLAAKIVEGLWRKTALLFAGCKILALNRRDIAKVNALFLGESELFVYRQIKLVWLPPLAYSSLHARKLEQPTSRLRTTRYLPVLCTPWMVRGTRQKSCQVVPSVQRCKSFRPLPDALTARVAASPTHRSRRY
jgi:hypothetical protein